MANLKDFFNKVLNDNRIYTAEDIGTMSAKEFSANEKAIDYQLENLGIPRRGDLVGNSDVVYVHAYTREDGTRVRAHYRSKNGGVYAGAASDVEQPLVLNGGVSYGSKSQKSAGSFDKWVLDWGIGACGLAKQEQDAVNLWNIASDGFMNEKNEQYINNNGKLYDSIDCLGEGYSKYKTRIKEKVQSQFGKSEIPGIVFHENSTVSNAIKNSQEFKTFVNKNLYDLKSGKDVKGSLAFRSDGNLKHAFVKIEILSSRLKKDYVEVILLDTYDFNANESNWLVQRGYSAQKAGLLNPYYTIVRCVYKLPRKINE